MDGWDGGFDGTRNAHRWANGQAWWRAGRAQLHSQYSWRCHGVWSGENSWYWMAREQAWPPTEHTGAQIINTLTIYTTVSPHRFGRASKLPRRSRCGFPPSDTDESADA